MSKSKKKRIKGNKLSSNRLQGEIMKLFKRHAQKTFHAKQIIKKLKITNNKDSVNHALEQLKEAGRVMDAGEGKFKVSGKSKAGSRSGGGSSFHEGVVDMTRSGSAYIVCEDLEEDVYVAAKNVNTALNRDKVKVRVWTPRGRNRKEGEVIDVLERATENYIGTFWQYPKYAIVIPDVKMPMDIIIENGEHKDAKDGDKVVVQILRWTGGQNRNPIGKISTVLGKAGSNDIEMKSILINNGFDLEFPQAVTEESEALSTDISEAELAVRLDMRDILTFTIDPDTAKDFDDALSFRYVNDGDIEIGVHIADVTHYVRQDTALDKEAFDRSTSVYLVDRVLPMLPEKLSNELCSLRPNEDKLTFSAIFTFNKDFNITKRWFGKTIIHSDRRFTYEEAQEILETGEGQFAGELKKLNEIAHKLRKQRFKEGSIAFETEEVKFRLDENGAPVEVYVKERKDAHMLIEDYMLLANKEVALFIDQKGKAVEQEIPFIYRVHDEPDPDRVAELAKFAQEMGFEMDVSTPQAVARSYNRMVKAATNDKGLKILEPIAIRTMAKAEYSPNNIGHYGLGFDYYTHFTSPIRRYSDVLCHRILEKNLLGIQRVNAQTLEEQCKHISMQERRAMEAERESVKYKQVEFIEKHIGEVFPGYINGMIERGIFVELVGNRCEGMVSFDSMPEPFDMGESRLQIVGRRSGKVYKIGDEILVKIRDADLSRRQIDMVWVEEAPDDVEYFE